MEYRSIFGIPYSTFERLVILALLPRPRDVQSENSIAIERPDPVVSPETAAAVRRAFIGAVTVAAVLLLAYVVWKIADILLLVFGSLLLSTFFRGLADQIVNRFRVPPRAALAMVFGTLILLILFLGSVVFPDVAQQVEELVTQLPEALTVLQGELQDSNVYRGLQQVFPGFRPDQTAVIGGATSAFATTLGAAANFIIVVFLTITFTFQHELYERGFLTLIPRQARIRAREVLSALRVTLWRWTLGQLISMSVVFVLTLIGLMALRVPLAFTLALFAGIIDFIPNFGPYIGAIPAVLIALLDGPTLMLYVILLYIAVQTVESYVVIPLVQQRMIDLPAAVTVTAQIVLGVLLGPLGLILATPLTAAVIVLVKLLYIEDVLGKEVTIPGETEKGFVTSG